MGLVFAALALLWWLMELLTFITADKQTVSELAETTPVSNDQFKAQAAAVAVAVALAEQQASLVHPLTDPPTAIVSAWQLGTRTRQLYEKGIPVVRKPRKIG